jgi:hypothetical protein
MKLMKFLVIALVAGGVCAPVASQAGEADGKAVMCEDNLDWRTELPYSDRVKSQGHHLTAHVFSDGYVVTMYVLKGDKTRPRAIYRQPNKSIYYSTPNEIKWGRTTLDRKTLRLDPGIYPVSRLSLSGTDRKLLFFQCELIDPDEIEAYFQPYLDYGNALDEKAREGNKL